MFALLEWLSRLLLPVTSRSAVAEFGPTVATRYPELANYTDAQLYAADRGELLAEILCERAAREAPVRKVVTR
jgi:hypothetical protein